MCSAQEHVLSSLKVEIKPRDHRDEAHHRAILIKAPSHTGSPHHKSPAETSTHHLLAFVTRLDASLAPGVSNLIVSRVYIPFDAWLNFG